MVCSAERHQWGLPVGVGSTLGVEVGGDTRASGLPLTTSREDAPHDRRGLGIETRRLLLLVGPG